MTSRFSENGTMSLNMTFIHTDFDLKGTRNVDTTTLNCRTNPWRQGRLSAEKKVGCGMETMVASLLIYSYFEPLNSSIALANEITWRRDNLKFFLRNGIPPPSQARTVLVANGGRVGVTVPPSVHVFKRPNVGLEFCGINEVIKRERSKYDYYVFKI